MRRLYAILVAGSLMLPCLASAQQSISRYTRDMEKRDGYFTLYWDAEEARLLLEVSRLGSEFLYLTSLATGLGSSSLGLDRGTIGNAFVAHFERHGGTVLLVLANPRFRADTAANPSLVRSVEESFPTSTVAAFEVLAEEDDGAVLIDASGHFIADHFGVIQRLEEADQGSFRLDRTRSRVYQPHTKAFPANTEVEVALTFTNDRPGSLIRSLAPDGRAVTLRQHHSLVQLPDDGYRPRRGDPHVGVFGISYFDFARSFDTGYASRYIIRHRLRKADPNVALSEPVEPIVYYLDSGIPEPYRTALRQGALWWNDVFRAAGFVNAFRIEDMPEGMDPMDARYNVIQWVHRGDAGSSFGPSLLDPRTGEIIKAAVRMDSHRSLTDFNIYAGMLPSITEPGDERLADWYASLDPNTSAEDFVMARRRQHAAHEVGHTLGLSHNFIAASHGRASVMDYPAPLIKLTNGQLDLSDAYRNGPGAYDSVAIRYAYTEFTPDKEEVGLQAIIGEALAHGLAFNADGDNASWGSYPEVTQWINGADPVTELARVLEVRRFLIDRFNETAIRDGEPMALLNQRFVPVYLHHRYTLEAAAKAIGGMEYRYAVRGDGTAPTRIIDPQRQREALEAVLDALEPSELAVPNAVLELMAPRAYGYTGDEWYFGSKAAPAFDQVGTARTLATMVIGQILAPQRVARLVAFNARDNASPAPEEVIARTIERTWGAPRGGVGAPYRRVVQRVVVDELIDLAADSTATVESRAAAEWGLRRIAEMIQTREVRLPEEEAHYTKAAADIRRFLDRPARAAVRSTPLAPPPAAPIGGGRGTETWPKP
jgi:hypothetical protein